MLAANTILDVRISPSSPVRLLRGQTLVLNCTTTTDLNTRVQMSWNYPGKVSGCFLVLRQGTICIRFEQVKPHWVFEVGKMRKSCSQGGVGGQESGRFERVPPSPGGLWV